MKGIDRVFKDKLKDEIRLLERERLSLIVLIHFSPRYSKKLLQRFKKLEEDCTDSFKTRYPAVYLGILKDQVAALKMEINLCNSFGASEWLM